MKAWQSSYFPFALIVSFFLLIGARNAGATTITFDDYTTNGPSTPDDFEVFSEGFAFKHASDVYDSCGGPCLRAGVEHGETHIDMFLPSAGDPEIASNGTFSILSFDAEAIAISLPGRGFATSYETAGNCELNTDHLTTCTVNWSDLNVAQFTITAYWSDGYSFDLDSFLVDNIVVGTAATPEPPTLQSALASFAFFAFGQIFRNSFRRYIHQSISQ